MGFPLGNFDPTIDIPQHLIDGARGLVLALPALYIGNVIDRGYAHWTVGHFNEDFSDYNVCVRYNPVTGLFALDVTHDPRDNVRLPNGSIGNPNGYAAHTYHRNTGAFGIATDDQIYATPDDFGPEPATVAAIQWMCAGIAGLSKKYGVDISGTSAAPPYANEPNILTHAEAAVRIGYPAQYYNYGPSGTKERWDWERFVPSLAEPLMDDNATTCGNAIRLFSHRIKELL